ncbi:RDD family protein [soil metagenome]
MNILQLRTPEGVVFSQILAGPVIRFAAWIIDFFVIVAIMSVLASVIVFGAVVSADFARALNVIAYFVISIGYGMFCEWLWRGQTIGKKLLRLRVVDAEGLRLQFNQIVIRNLLRFVDSLPFCYLIGGVVCWITRRNQRLGDIAANTVVIRLPMVRQPDLDQVLPDKYNSLRAYPHLEARLRQQVTPAEAAIALKTLLRRNDFDPAARVQLFAEIAAHFRAKVAFPPEASDGLSDERYLRNVVDILYRARRAEAPKSPAIT